MKPIAVACLISLVVSQGYAQPGGLSSGQTPPRRPSGRQSPTKAAVWVPTPLGKAPVGTPSVMYSQAVTEPGLTIFDSGSLKASLSQPSAVYVTDPGRQGLFILDKADLTSPHDGVMTIVNAAGKRYKRDVSGLKGLEAGWFGAKGDGVTDNTAAFASAREAAVRAKLPLFFPAGTFLFKSTTYLAGGLTLRGSGQDKTVFTFGADFSGSSLFEGIGCSSLTLEDFSIRGTARALEAGIRLNSHPSQASNITINRLTIQDFWGNGIMMGGSGANETHFNQDVQITNCRLVRIGKPGSLVIRQDNVAITHGIHLNQSTKRLLVAGNTITDCSGDGIFAWQYNNQKDPEASSFQIKDNFIARTWMGVECMSYGANNKGQISDNIILYPNRNYGFGISATGDLVDISGNLVVTIERIPLEIGINRGTVSNNRLFFSVKKTADDVGADGFETGTQALALAQLYNNAVKFTDNLGYVDARNASGKLVSRVIRGVELLGKHGEYPATVFTDFSSYLEVTDNSFYGITGAAVCATVSPIRKAQIRNNTFQLTDFRNDLACLLIYGYDWEISNNNFDLTNVAAPPSHIGLIGVHNALQKNTHTRSQVHMNRFYASEAWTLKDPAQFISTLNFFIDPATATVQVEMAGIRMKSQPDAAPQQLGFFGAAPSSRPAPLAVDINKTAGSTYTATEKDILNNVRIRLKNLESNLKQLGLQN